MSECVKMTVMHNLYAGFIKTHEICKHLVQDLVNFM